MFACEYVFQTKSKNNIYKKKTLWPINFAVRKESAPCFLTVCI
jgi:hypothetical protein